MNSPFESELQVPRQAGAFIDDRDLGIWNHGTGRIGHRADDGAADRLRCHCGWHAGDRKREYDENLPKPPGARKHAAHHVLTSTD